MKGVSIIPFGLIFLPLAGICHIALSLVLLSMHIGGRAAYVWGDIIVVLAALGIVFFLYKKNPLQKNIPDGNVSDVPGKNMLSEEQYKKTRKKYLASIFVIISLLLSIGLLWSVRYAYTGPAYDGVEIIDIKDARIYTPVFSDEWLLSGLVKKTIEKRSLPLFDPLKYEFVHRDNFLAPLISGMATFAIVKNIDPVNSFWVFVFIFQAAFVLIWYLFLRTFSLGKPASLIGVLMLICLPESNLAPGIWILLPAYIGLFFILSAFIFIHSSNSRFVTGRKNGALLRHIGIFANLILGSLIYPPYFILIAAFLIIRYIRSWKALCICLVSIAVLIYALAKATGILIGPTTIMPFFETIGRMAVHYRFGSSTGHIWQFIPAAFIFLASIGFALIAGRTWLNSHQRKTVGWGMAALLFSICLTYAFDIELVLSHQRSVFIIWLLMVVCVATATDRLIYKRNKLEKMSLQLTQGARPASTSTYSIKIMWMAGLIVVQIILLFTGGYSGVPAWHGIVADSDIIIGKIPSRPIMLDMVESIPSENIREMEGKRFIATPYMALAIGATTDLEPISASPSFMSIFGPTLHEMQQLKTCGAKANFMNTNSLSLAIVHSSNDFLDTCPEFQRISNIVDSKQYATYAYTDIR